MHSGCARYTPGISALTSGRYLWREARADFTTLLACGARIQMRLPRNTVQHSALRTRALTHCPSKQNLVSARRSVGAEVAVRLWGVPCESVGPHAHLAPRTSE
jgi:hypothetical protein